MKVDVIGGGPAGLYFAILAKKAWPQMRHHRLRAQPAGRHVRLRRRVLRRDARDLREIRPRELPRDHGEFRLLGRHRDPFQGHGAPHRRQRLLRLLARDAAAAAAGARPRARRRAEIPDRDRSATRIATPTWSSRPTASIRASARSTRTHSSRASICGRTSSPGWARRARSTPSRSSSARPSTASSSRTATSTSRANRPG